ncbi:hypothetical protein VP01_2643g1 [Puccinia sorghi]|uniref:Uncharacterized protein n=1 Tax=Puccinia sorghi TaxID=27349 RepID=A0A0L6V4X4_9BASI|nr:hypothetical protein VP01_2643g1 [Puccinia sorghi]
MFFPAQNDARDADNFTEIEMAEFDSNLRISPLQILLSITRFISLSFALHTHTNSSQIFLVISSSVIHSLNIVSLHPQYPIRFLICINFKPHELIVILFQVPHSFSRDINNPCVTHQTSVSASNQMLLQKHRLVNQTFSKLLESNANTRFELRLSRKGTLKFYSATQLFFDITPIRQINKYCGFCTSTLPIAIALLVILLKPKLATFDNVEVMIIFKTDLRYINISLCALYHQTPFSTLGWSHDSILINYRKSSELSTSAFVVTPVLLPLSHCSFIWPCDVLHLKPDHRVRPNISWIPTSKIDGGAPPLIFEVLPKEAKPCQPSKPHCRLTLSMKVEPLLWLEMRIQPRFSSSSFRPSNNLAVLAFFSLVNFFS